MMTLTPEQRRQIDQDGHARIEDGAYVVLRADVYERLLEPMDYDDSGELVLEELPLTCYRGSHIMHASNVSGSMFEARRTG